MLLINLSRYAFFWFDADDPRFRVGAVSLHDWLLREGDATLPEGQFTGFDLIAWQGVWVGDRVVELSCADPRRAWARLFDQIGEEAIHYVDLTSVITGLLIKPDCSDGFAMFRSDTPLRLLCLLESTLCHEGLVARENTPASTLVSWDGRLQVYRDRARQNIDVEYHEPGAPVLRHRWPELQFPLLPAILGRLHCGASVEDEQDDFRTRFNPLAGNAEAWRARVNLMAIERRVEALDWGWRDPNLSSRTRSRYPVDLFLDAERRIDGLDIHGVVGIDSLGMAPGESEATFVTAVLLTVDGLVLPALLCPSVLATAGLRRVSTLMAHLRLRPCSQLSRNRLLGSFLSQQLFPPVTENEPQGVMALRSPPFILDLMTANARYWLLPRDIAAALKQPLSPIRFTHLVRAVSGGEGPLRDALLHTSLLGEILVRMPEALDALRNATPLGQVASQCLGASLRSIKKLDATLRANQVSLLLTLFPPESYREVIPFLAALSEEETTQLLDKAVLSGLAQFLVSLQATPEADLPAALWADSATEALSESRSSEARSPGRLLAVWRWVGQQAQGHRRLLKGMAANRLLPDGSLALDVAFRADEALADWWQRVQESLSRSLSWMGQLQRVFQPDRSPGVARGRSGDGRRRFGNITVMELLEDHDLDLVGRQLSFCLSASYGLSGRKNGLSRLFLLMDATDEAGVAVLEVSHYRHEDRWDIVHIKGRRNQEAALSLHDAARQLVAELNQELSLGSDLQLHCRHPPCSFPTP